MNAPGTRDRTHYGRQILQWPDIVLLSGCVLFSLAFTVVPEQPDAPLPDFSALDTSARKQAFFDYLKPLLADVNAAARADREFVRSVSAAMERGDRLSAYQRRRIDALTERYDVPAESADPSSLIDALERRAGIVPESLALIQAAKESGWGTSRFAVEGNNLFGQRCYSPGCGITPRRQAENASWAVARYDSVRDSLNSYLMNLNTHPEYREFRAERQQMRQTRQALSGVVLAGALDAYSERGTDYVDEIRKMIRQNNLE